MAQYDWQMGMTPGGGYGTPFQPPVNSGGWGMIGTRPNVPRPAIPPSWQTSPRPAPGPSMGGAPGWSGQTGWAQPYRGPNPWTSLSPATPSPFGPPTLPSAGGGPLSNASAPNPLEEARRRWRMMLLQGLGRR